MNEFDKWLNKNKINMTDNEKDQCKLILKVTDSYEEFTEKFGNYTNRYSIIFYVDCYYKDVLKNVHLDSHHRNKAGNKSSEPRVKPRWIRDGSTKEENSIDMDISLWTAIKFRIAGMKNFHSRKKCGKCSEE